MLCDVCQAIDLTRAGTPVEDGENFRSNSPYRHHLTFKALKLSAQRGCHLCSVFAQELRRESVTEDAIEQAATRGATTEITLSVPGGRTVANTIGAFHVDQRVNTFVRLCVKCDTDTSEPGRSAFLRDMINTGIWAIFDLFSKEGGLGSPVPIVCTPRLIVYQEVRLPKVSTYQAGVLLPVHWIVWIG
jgi:hypothetical protein